VCEHRPNFVAAIKLDSDLAMLKTESPISNDGFTFRTDIIRKNIPLGCNMMEFAQSKLERRPR
jgi:hypothetical protein